MRPKNKKVATILYSLLGWGLATIAMYLLGIDLDGYLGPMFFGLVIGILTLFVFKKLGE